MRELVGFHVVVCRRTFRIEEIEKTRVVWSRNLHNGQTGYNKWHISQSSKSSMVYIQLTTILYSS
jgi:hypothetical protein